ncbi:MAG: transcriptional repressor [Actinobacteria bacterium]|nr:MAG: transcriptional repressor [Actinomycetota bacterium]
MRPEGSLLGQAGLRSTPQRLAIIRAVAAQPRPVTAQELYARLRGKRGSPGLATVYRTLNSLSEAGVLRTFAAGEGELAYRLCEPGHHHHLICESCGKVVEIPSCEVEEWADGVASRRGFVAIRHQADIFGLCASCRPEATGPTRHRPAGPARRAGTKRGAVRLTS